MTAEHTALKDSSLPPGAGCAATAPAHEPAGARTALSRLLYDLRAQSPPDVPSHLRLVKHVYNVLAISGVHALVILRLGQVFESLGLVPLSYVCRKLLYHFYHLDIWPGTDIGGGHWLCHALGVVYTRHARIGRRVQVFQNVGVVSGPGGSPVIGDFVKLYAGACVVGRVTVGRGAMIGALAVVTHDVPDYAVVAGNPARILRYRWHEEVDSEDDFGQQYCQRKAERSEAVASEPRPGSAFSRGIE